MSRYFSMDLVHAGYVAGPFNLIARVGIFLFMENIFRGGGGIGVVGLDGGGLWSGESGGLGVFGRELVDLLIWIWFG